MITLYYKMLVSTKHNFYFSLQNFVEIESLVGNWTFNISIFKSNMKVRINYLILMFTKHFLLNTTYKKWIILCGRESFVNCKQGRSTFIQTGSLTALVSYFGES